MLPGSQGQKYDPILNSLIMHLSDLHKSNFTISSYLHLGLPSGIFPSGFIRPFYASLNSHVRYT